MTWRIKLFSLLLASCTLVTFSSCGGDEDPGPANEELLQQFFSENNISPQKTASGLYYVIDIPGNDTMPTRSSTVVVHYEGFFLNGEIFDSSIERGAPAEFSLRAVIPGWTEGIPLFGKGGKGSLYVPSQLGYGTAGSSSGIIPPDTPIAFNIELIDIK